MFKTFMDVVAKKYDVDFFPVKKHTKPVQKNLEDAISFFKEELKPATQVKLSSLKNDDLKKMLKGKGLKTGGKKEDLIKRIENPLASDRAKGGIKFKSKSINKVPEIITKLKGPVSRLAIRKNNEGHYVHLETNIVFDVKTGYAYGSWKDNKIQALTKEDINKCIDFNIPYMIPENLDYGSTVVVDEKLDEELGEEDFKPDDYESDDEGDEEEGDEED